MGKLFFWNSQTPYRNVFAGLPDNILQEMVSDTADVQFVGMRNFSAEYDLRRITDGKTYSYYLMFIKDRDGLWKIRAF